jgi:hypothetical protein
MSASLLFRAMYTFYDLFFASMFSPLENFNPKLSSRMIHTGSFEVKLSSQGTSACSMGLAQVSKGRMLKHFSSPFFSEKFFKSKSLIKAAVVRTQYLYLRFMRQRTFVAS